MTLSFESNPMVRIEALQASGCWASALKHYTSQLKSDGPPRSNRTGPPKRHTRRLAVLHVSNPLAYRGLGLNKHGLTTRRWFCFIPSDGTHIGIVSTVEAHRVEALSFPDRIVYRCKHELCAPWLACSRGDDGIAMNSSARLRYCLRLARAISGKVNWCVPWASRWSRPLA